MEERKEKGCMCKSKPPKPEIDSAPLTPRAVHPHAGADVRFVSRSVAGCVVAGLELSCLLTATWGPWHPAGLRAQAPQDRHTAAPQAQPCASVRPGDQRAVGD